MIKNYLLALALNIIFTQLNCADLQRKKDEALMQAIVKKDAKKVLEALQNGANSNVQDRDGNTALQNAVSNGSEEIVKLLIQFNADPNLSEIKHVLPIYTAIDLGNEEIFNILLPKVAINRSAPKYLTPLHFALKKQRINFAQKLIKDPDINLSIYVKEPDILMQIIKLDPNVIQWYDQRDNNLLHYAAKFGNLESAKLLIGAGISPISLNDNNKTPAQIATENNQLEIAQYILNVKEEQDKKSKQLIEFASEGDIKNVMQTLSIPGIDINFIGDFGITPLMRAAQGSNDPNILKNKEEIARELLKKGAFRDVQDEMGQTALHWAAQYGRENLVKILLEFKANSKVKDNLGKTPKDLAETFNHQNVVKLLS